MSVPVVFNVESRLGCAQVMSKCTPNSTSADLGHVHNAETWFYCPHMLLSLKFYCILYFQCIMNLCEVKLDVLVLKAVAKSYRPGQQGDRQLLNWRLRGRKLHRCCKSKLRRQYNAARSTGVSTDVDMHAVCSGETNSVHVNISANADCYRYSLTQARVT